MIEISIHNEDRSGRAPTPFDKNQIAQRWQVQLDFVGGHPKQALRMGAVTGSLARLTRADSCVDGDLIFPHHAYLAPIGTREQLLRLAGRPAEKSDAVPPVLESGASPLGMHLADQVRFFPKLSTRGQCELLSTLLNCALYPLAGRLIESEIDIDVDDEWGSWLLYQMGRLVQRLEGLFGAPDSFFETVAAYAPHKWQRYAAVGQLIARYARIAPSPNGLARYAAQGSTLLASPPADRFESFDIEGLWASRLLRSIALAEFVRGDKNTMISMLQRAEEWQDGLNQQYGESDLEIRHLLDMNRRLLVEARLKSLSHDDAHGDEIVQTYLSLDPGCADVIYVAGRHAVKRRAFEHALTLFKQSYLLGTMRSAQAAVGLAKVYFSEFDDKITAAEWVAAGVALDRYVDLPAELNDLRCHSNRESR